MKGFKKLIAILSALTISTATFFAFGCVNNDGKTDVIGNINGIVSSAGNNKNDGENIEVLNRKYKIDDFVYDMHYEMQSPVYLRSGNSLGRGIDLVKTAYLDLTELKTGSSIFEQSFIDEQAEKATVKTLNYSLGKIFDASDLDGVAEGLEDPLNINVSSEVKKAMRITNAKKILNDLHCYNNYTGNYFFVLTKTFNGYSLKFPAYSGDLSVCKANLSSFFIESVEQVIGGDMSCEKFFRTFGTHVILEGIFGGKIKLCYGVQSNKYDVGSAYRETITDGIKSAFEGEDSKSLSQISNITCKALNCALEDFSASFSGTYTGAIPFPLTSMGNYINAVKEWLPDLDEENVMISITENGAVPIWKLLPEKYESYSAEFEQAVNDYAVNYINSLLNA